MVEAMPGTASANADYSSIVAIPACLDAWDKPAGRGNDTAALRKLG